MQLEPTGERIIEEFYLNSPQNYFIYPKRLIWLTLSLILPFVPEAIRIATLKMLKRLAGVGKQKAQKTAETFPFGEADLVFSSHLSPNVNLIAIAYKL